MVPSPKLLTEQAEWEQTQVNQATMTLFKAIDDYRSLRADGRLGNFLLLFDDRGRRFNNSWFFNCLFGGYRSDRFDLLDSNLLASYFFLCGLVHAFVATLLLNHAIRDEIIIVHANFTA